jgi:hypothetical protein
VREYDLIAEWYASERDDQTGVSRPTDWRDIAISLTIAPIAKMAACLQAACPSACKLEVSWEILANRLPAENPAS